MNSNIGAEALTSTPSLVWWTYFGLFPKLWSKSRTPHMGQSCLWFSLMFPLGPRAQLIPAWSRGISLVSVDQNCFEDWTNTHHKWSWSGDLPQNGSTAPDQKVNLDLTFLSLQVPSPHLYRVSNQMLFASTLTSPHSHVSPDTSLTWFPREDWGWGYHFCNQLSVPLRWLEKGWKHNPKL